MIPDDLLCPIWRQRPAMESATFTIGLDPREAAVVLARGWASLDGIRYRATTEGCDPNIQGDGRIMIRCDCPEQEPTAIGRDPLDRWAPLRRIARRLRVAA